MLMAELHASVNNTADSKRPADGKGPVRQKTPAEAARDAKIGYAMQALGLRFKNGEISESDYMTKLGEEIASAGNGRSEADQEKLKQLSTWLTTMAKASKGDVKSKEVMSRFGVMSNPAEQNKSSLDSGEKLLPASVFDA